MQQTNGQGDQPRQNGRLIDLSDTVVALIIIAGCAFLYYQTTQFEEVSTLLGDNVLPADFPRLVLYIVAALALFLPFEHRFESRWKKIKESRSERIPMRTFATMALVLAILAAAPYLGTILVIVLSSLLLPLLWGERRLWLVLIYAALFSAAIVLLFAVVLKVHFEPGMFGIQIR